MNLKTMAAALLAAAAVAPGLPSPAAAQSPVLLEGRSGSPPGDRFRVDSSGAFVAYGSARDVGNGTGCAAQVPATGPGTRFEWHPCRAALRFGRAITEWDDANMDDFTFAGGNGATASARGAFAFGESVTVSGVAGAGFGNTVTVSGTGGFGAGYISVCSGFGCTAIGYSVRAGGLGSVALGYRATANNDYSVALGNRASNNTHTGTMVMGDGTISDSVRNQADNEFRIRYTGGIRLRVSAASNGNTPGAVANVGCDLTVAVPSWTCASSRTLKENYRTVDGEDVLMRLRALPITTWSMIGGDRSVRHLGPVAEDFYHAYGLGLGETTIGLGDIDGVNLAAAKALEARTAELRRDLEARTAELRRDFAAGDAAHRRELATRDAEAAALRGELAELRAQVQALARAQAGTTSP
ncbi:MAG TPA: tail fiber domain-containing protein [Longimicrobium sp.]|jgi:hypothetical protein|nr:tail fiber domain-containing protein [Longimicrobium sp.]